MKKSQTQTQIFALFKHALKNVFCVCSSVRCACKHIISGVYGGGGAGAAGYRGGAGPLITMINQVQMISMLGRTGGEQGFPSTKVFSNGFVWSNLDANLDEATAERAQGASPCVGTLCINTKSSIDNSICYDDEDGAGCRCRYWTWN